MRYSQRSIGQNYQGIELSTDYYDDETELIQLLQFLINKSKEKIFFFGGKTDMFLLDYDTDQYLEEIKSNIKSQGEIDLVKHVNDDFEIYSGWISPNANACTVLKFIKFFYSAKFVFNSKDNSYDSWFDYCNDLWQKKDIDSVRAFQTFEFDYVLFKGLGPDVIYVNYPIHLNEEILTVLG